MIDRIATTAKVIPVYDGPRINLGDVLIKEQDVPEEFFISDDKLPAWTYLKGAKKEERKTSTGHVYHYAEGSMTFPDALNKPSRTIITGEGGAGASRFKHVIWTSSSTYPTRT